MITEMSETTIHYWVYIVLIFLTFSLICYITWLIFGLSFFFKIGFSIGGRALSLFLIKMGCSIGLTWAIGFAVKAFLATEGTPYVWHNMMAPAGGEGGSGAGSSQRPVHLDLNLPTGSRDELSDLVAELDQVEREIRHLSESPTEGLEARQEKLARLNTVLDEIDRRLDQAREIDSACDQERARQRAELNAQMEPLYQTEARLAARRQNFEQVLTSLQLQLRAQDQFLQDAGEGSTSAPVLKK